jgi:hypothetical protein
MGCADYGSASLVEFRGGTRVKYAESNSVQLPVIRANGHYRPEGVVCRELRDGSETIHIYDGAR